MKVYLVVNLDLNNREMLLSVYKTFGSAVKALSTIINSAPKKENFWVRWEIREQEVKEG